MRRLRWRMRATERYNRGAFRAYGYHSNHTVLVQRCFFHHKPQPRPTRTCPIKMSDNFMKINQFSKLSSILKKILKADFAQSTAEFSTFSQSPDAKCKHLQTGYGNQAKLQCAPTTGNGCYGQRMHSNRVIELSIFATCHFGGLPRLTGTCRGQLSVTDTLPNSTPKLTPNFVPIPISVFGAERFRREHSFFSPYSGPSPWRAPVSSHNPEIPTVDCRRPAPRFKPKTARTGCLATEKTAPKVFALKAHSTC